MIAQRSSIRYALSLAPFRRLARAVAVGAGLVALQPAAAETVSPRRLVEVVDLGNPAISPDGRFVAFRSEQASVERNTYDTVWYVQRVDGRSPPVRVGEGGAPLFEPVNGVVRPSPAIWSMDGRWIYYRALLAGRVSVWRAAADGSGAEEVTSDAADVRDFQLGADGQSLIYSVGASRDAVEAAERTEYDQGVRIDDMTVIGAGLSRSTLVEGRPATQHFLGDWFSTGALLAETPDRWRSVDLSTMATRDLSQVETPRPALSAADMPEGLPEISQAVESPDTGSVVVLLPVSRSDDGVVIEPGADVAILDSQRAGRLHRCSDRLCIGQMITHVQWRPGGKEVLFTTTEYARTQSIFAWNPSTGVVRPIVRADGLVSGSRRYWDTSCGVSSAALVCVAAEAGRPPRLEAIDLDSGMRRILFEPNKALEAAIARTTPAQLLRWTDDQGRRFTGRLFEARGAGSSRPPPLFVTFYNCYGFQRGGMGDEWPLASLAEAGISALCINAIPEYRRDFVGRHDQGRIAVESVVAFLASQGRVDPTRVGMGGLSYGSEVTLWTLMNSDVVTVASISSPSVTPNWYLFNSLRDAFRTNAMLNWQLGGLNETPEQWRAVSPAFQLERIRSPILFQMPEQEYLMSLEYALPLIRRKQAELYAFPQEAHIKFQPRHKLAVYERNLDWFRFWLQNYEDSDPKKSDQYQRWREMRQARDTNVGGPTRRLH